jgi:hypothetical protein
MLLNKNYLNISYYNIIVRILTAIVLYQGIDIIYKKYSDIMMHTAI